MAYLTTPRSGQLVLGLRAADWALARIALYQWGPVLAVVGFLLLATGLAAGGDLPGGRWPGPAWNDCGRSIGWQLHIARQEKNSIGQHSKMRGSKVPG